MKVNFIEKINRKILFVKIFSILTAIYKLIEKIYNIVINNNEITFSLSNYLKTKQKLE